MIAKLGKDDRDAAAPFRTGKILYFFPSPIYDSY